MFPIRSHLAISSMDRPYSPRQEVSPRPNELGSAFFELSSHRGLSRTTSLPDLSIQNPGFFHRASNFDASGGIFTEFTGNQHVINIFHHNYNYQIHNSVVSLGRGESVYRGELPRTIETWAVDRGLWLLDAELGKTHRIPNPSSLSLGGSWPSDKVTSAIIYEKISMAGFSTDKDGPHFLESLRPEVESILLAFNPQLCSESLAELLGTSPERLWTILRFLNLHPVTQNSDFQVIPTCHKPFNDMLSDIQRFLGRTFCDNGPSCHMEFCIRCLELMKKALKRNICDLPEYAMNEDVKDFATRRREFINAPLMYACESWANHMRSGTRTGGGVGVVTQVIALLHEFFENHFLSWLEVLSICGNLRVAIHSLQNVKFWLANSMPSRPSKLLDLIDDCERFVLRFFDVIGKSASHIYHSALLWSPMSSLIRKLYQGHTAPRVKLLNAVDGTWDTGRCITTIPTRNGLTTIAFSHMGSSIAVGTFEYVTIFTTVTGLATFEVQKSIDSVAFSPHDDFLVGGLVNKTVAVWNVQTSNLVRTFVGHKNTICSVAFSPCGDLIASGSSDQTIIVWKVSLDHLDFVLAGHSGAVRSVCWSGNGKSVISASDDTTVRIWDVQMRTCSNIIGGHSGPVTSVASSRDSKFFASGCYDKTVKVYNSGSGDACQAISTDGKAHLVQFSRSGDKLMYTTYHSAVMWDLAKEKRVMTIDCNGYCAAFSPDGTHVASSEPGSFVKIWKTEKETKSNEYTGDRHSKAVNVVAFAPDGRLISSQSFRDGRIWDAASGKCLFMFDSDIYSIVFSADSTFVAILSCFVRDANDVLCRRVRLWKVRTRRLASTLYLDHHTHHIALSPDGTRLVSLSISRLTLWKLPAAKELAHITFDVPIPSNSQLAFSADGARVFVKYGDHCETGWNISPASPSKRHFSKSISLRMESIPRDGWPVQDDFVPSPLRYRYKRGDEWIMNRHGERVLWVPQDRRASSSDTHENKVAVGTESGSIYIVDFSDRLSV